MKNKVIKALMNSAEALLEELINTHDCGWFDGGCFTLASAINELFPSTEIYHISRNASLRDHAVVYVPSLNAFIDADGLQSKEELFTKMKEVEMTNVSVCEPFLDIHKSDVYLDIKQKLIAHYNKNKSCS